MKKRLIVLILTLALVSTLATFVSAQGGPGQGGIVFLNSIVSDPPTYIPMIYSDNDSQVIFKWMYPNVFGVNPATGAFEPGFADSLAIDWSFDETGTVLTASLRQDAFWSDGVQITANDFIWMLEALRSGLLSGPRATETWESLDDGTPGSGTLVDAVALDDFTVQLTFAAPDCNALANVFDYVVPSHIFEEDFGDDLAAMNDEPRYLPGVYFGPFVEPELAAGDRVSLVANQEYPDAELGYVSPSELVELIIPDQDVAIERFRAGDITMAGIPATYQAEFAADPDYQTYRFPRQGYVFYAFNQANPDNPADAYDEDGNYLGIDPHPVLGDRLVRQAITYSVNMDAIIENYLDGNAVRVGIPSIPSSWDFDADLLYPFDPVMAAQLLDEAGWVMGDGEFRVCQGCAYTEIDPAYEGTEMVVTLNADESGTEDSRQMIEFIAQSMRDVGINAQVNFIDWGSAFVPALLNQEFDMAILAWNLGLPLDPDNSNIFSTQADVLGGFNFVSYHNEEIDQLYLDARNPALTDGCTVEGRLPFYARANEILFEDVPYMFMYANLSMAAAHNYVEGWDPVVFSRTWDLDTWAIDQP
ncbi:MAG: hypothetical protein JW910_10175 [Anaerolineae bacterium]|nr:hypothetical protein [Anaerolineae bacterium]